VTARSTAPSSQKTSQGPAAMNTSSVGGGGAAPWPSGYGAHRSGSKPAPLSWAADRDRRGFRRRPSMMF
jgi:hypothetical protein